MSAHQRLQRVAGPIRALALTVVYRLWRITWRIQRPVTIGVRIAGFDERGHLLMVRHSYLKGWYLPGGMVDSGETLPVAAARELREETGLEALDTPRLMGIHSGFHYGKSDHVALFRTRVSGTPQIDGWEIIEVGFFPLHALPDALSPSTRSHIPIVTGRGVPELE